MGVYNAAEKCSRADLPSLCKGGTEQSEEGGYTCSHLQGLSELLNKVKFFFKIIKTSQGGFPAAAGHNLRMPAPQQGEFAQLYNCGPFKNAARGT